METDYANNENKTKWVYPVFLVLFLLIFFVLLEYRYPYFFLQDDNMDFNFPNFVHDYRAFINGELALYNFHQYLGTPFLASGQAGTLYPLTYIAVFLSNFLYGHYFAAIDIYVIIHLIIGGLGFYALAKGLGLDDKSALFSASAWPLCSFIVYASDSWVHISPVAAYFPWMIYFAHKLYKDANYKNLTLLVIVRLLLFYTGHPQLFVYSGVFEFLTIAFMTYSDYKENKNKAILKDRIKYYIYSYIITFALALPLLLPEYYQMKISSLRSIKMSFDEFTGLPYDPIQWVIGLIYPFLNTLPLYASTRHLNNLSHIGYLPLIFMIAVIIRHIKKKEIFGKQKKIYIFVNLAGIAILWASFIPFEALIYLIPILNRFRMQYKIEIYVSFYMMILAAYGFNIWFREKDYKEQIKRLVFVGIMMINIINFSCLYFLTQPKAFRAHFDTVPFEEPLKDKLTDGKIFTIGYMKFGVADYEKYTVNSIGFNYATFWGLYHFAGSDPLLPKDNSDACFSLNYDAVYRNEKGDIASQLTYLRNWGVKWYVVKNGYNLEYKGFEEKYKDDKRTVYYDKDAKPFVYWNDASNKGTIDFEIKTNSIIIRTNSLKDETINVNFLYNKFFKCTVDNNEVDIAKGDHNQMTVNEPSGVHTIIIKYNDPYFNAGCCISGCALAILFVMFIYKLKTKKC